MDRGVVFFFAPQPAPAAYLHVSVGEPAIHLVTRCPSLFLEAALFWVVCPRETLGVPSIPILSRDPNLFRKPSNTQGKQPFWKERWLKGMDKESTRETNGTPKPHVGFLSRHGLFAGKSGAQGTRPA